LKKKMMILRMGVLLFAITATGKSAQISAAAIQPAALDAAASEALSESVLWSFGATSTDGVNPYAGLIADRSGNLYGTTFGGGTNDAGTVFELRPPVWPQRQWSESVLWSFGATSTDGANPYLAGLIADQWGNLYGTTFDGGMYGDGTVFELRPPTSGHTQWSESVLWSFLGPTGDGAFPVAGLIADRLGNLYGTTEEGGTNCLPGGCGTVFELRPPSRQQTHWSESLLWSFGATSTDGDGPYAGLTADQWGNLYGTTFGGGMHGYGAVFQLRPPAGPQTQWSESVLWSFGATSTDGVEPYAGLIADRSGNLYGTTFEGGMNGDGTVFELRPPAGAQTQWSESVLWSFLGATGDGALPYAGLIADRWGNLYGTTEEGGANDNSGTVFELRPPAGPQTQWSESLLWSFGATGDGKYPYAGLIADQWGNLYGTTLDGGANCLPGGCGTVFELSLP
jgi:uncharacterized repeat protein (TIGR03803 family)